MNFLPLCTAIVCPTISGITVERRDHVLMTRFSFAAFIASIFSSSGVSTNGPFFSERLIALLRPLLHDEAIGVLAATGLEALRRLTPRRHRVPATGRLAFATTERVIDRVHGHAAYVRALAQPAAATRLADRHVLVIEVAHLADGGNTLDQNL